MYQLCLLEPALFRFLHDAPRSELLIDLPGRFFRLFEDTWRRGAELHPPNRRESHSFPRFRDISGGSRAATRCLGELVSDQCFTVVIWWVFLFKCACCGQSIQWQERPQEPLIWPYRSFYTFTLWFIGTFTHQFIQFNPYLDLTDNQTNINKAFCIILSLVILQ